MKPMYPARKTRQKKNQIETAFIVTVVARLVSVNSSFEEIRWQTLETLLSQKWSLVCVPLIIRISYLNNLSRNNLRNILLTV